MKITDLEIQKHNKQRVSVFVDGEYAFSLSDTDIILLGIKVGREIDQKEIEELNIRCNYTKALSTSLDAISRKAQTEKQISDKLKKSGYDKQIIEDVINELKSMGYIDDVEYALSFAKDAVTYKNLGREKIIGELRIRGVSYEDIESALEGFDFNTCESIRQHIMRKFAKEDFSDDKVKQKAMRYLMYRGFSASQAAEGIKRYTNNMEE